MRVWILVLLVIIPLTASGLPVSKWNMDESSWNGTSGEAQDVYGVSNGTAYNSVNVTIGLFGNAGNFTASNHYLELNPTAYFNNSTVYTVNSWINKTDTAPSRHEAVMAIGSTSTRLTFIAKANTGVKPQSYWDNTNSFKHSTYIFRQNIDYMSTWVINASNYVKFFVNATPVPLGHTLINATPDNTTDNPQGLAYNPVDGYLYFAADRGDSVIYQINKTTGLPNQSFLMPAEASHTGSVEFAPDNSMWAIDYDSDKVYKINLSASLASGNASIIGSFNTSLNGSSALTFALYNGVWRMVISDYQNTAKTYILDETSALASGNATFLANYTNNGNAQGLLFIQDYLPGRDFICENGANGVTPSAINCFNLEDAVTAGTYNTVKETAILEPVNGGSSQDIAWDGEYFWITDESVGFRNFYKYNVYTLSVGNLPSLSGAGRIGTSDKSSETFQGRIDETSLYIEELNLSQVMDIYSAGFPSYDPPTPASCTSVVGTTWINVTCSEGAGNVTDEMNFVNVNTSLWQNSSSFSFNNTGLSSSTSYTYYIYAVNTSGFQTTNLTYIIHTNTTTLDILYAPNITSWNNTNTSNNNLTIAFSLNVSASETNNVTFNVTANQTITGCTWIGATQINCSGTESYAYKNFSAAGIFTIISTVSNVNGTSSPITWTITIIDSSPVTPAAPSTYAGWDSNTTAIDTFTIIGKLLLVLIIVAVFIIMFTILTKTSEGQTTDPFILVIAGIVIIVVFIAYQLISIIGASIAQI